MGGAGFEPAKAMPPDLQSGPFGRLGIHPNGNAPHALALRSPETALLIQEPGRAGGGTRTHNPRFTKPMLYRLSYASGLRRETTYYISEPPRCKAFPNTRHLTKSGRRAQRTTSAASRSFNHNASPSSETSPSVGKSRPFHIAGINKVLQSTHEMTTEWRKCSLSHMSSAAPVRRCLYDRKASERLPSGLSGVCQPRPYR